MHTDGSYLSEGKTGFLFSSRLMASYIVDSSQVLSATTGADSVWLQSGGHSSTIYGLAGNDTITVDQVSNASSLGAEMRPFVSFVGSYLVPSKLAWYPPASE